MYTETAVTLARHTLETTLWLAAPILIVAIVVGVGISILQVMTSIQDATISSVPRLAAVGLVVFVLMPWLLRRLIAFTLHILGDFRPYLG